MALELEVKGVMWCADGEPKPATPNSGTGIRTDHALMVPLSPLTQLPESAEPLRALSSHVAGIVRAIDGGQALVAIRSELQHLAYLCEAVANVASVNAQNLMPTTDRVN